MVPSCLVAPLPKALSGQSLSQFVLTIPNKFCFSHFVTVNVAAVTLLNLLLNVGAPSHMTWIFFSFKRTNCIPRKCLCKLSEMLLHFQWYQITELQINNFLNIWQKNERTNSIYKLTLISVLDFLNPYNTVYIFIFFCFILKYYKTIAECCWQFYYYVVIDIFISIGLVFSIIYIVAENDNGKLQETPKICR